MAFVKTSDSQCTTSFNHVAVGFEYLFRQPFRIANNIQETANQHDSGPKDGDCSYCLISDIISKKIEVKEDENVTEVTPAKRPKLDPSAREPFPKFLTAPCQVCLGNEMSNAAKLRGILRDIVLFWFEESDGIQKVKSNFRRLTSKDSALVPTYEWVLYNRSNSILTLVVMPMCTLEDPKLLLHRSYALTYNQSEKQLSTYIHADFANAVSDKAFVLSEAGLNHQIFYKISKIATTGNRKTKKAMSLINAQKYQKLYSELKEKYASYFISIWSGSTDPLFFVYKGIAVATYMLLLWEKERNIGKLTDKQSFTDLRCGNGLLVHILSSQGHPGKGIDVAKDKMWDSYGSSTILEESPIYPHKLKVETDWIIGYNADELTPWIPIIAARSSYTTRFFVLPCCLYDFDKVKGRGETHGEDYNNYLKFLDNVASECGFNVEQDELLIRIQSRKCIIGHSRSSKVELVPWYHETIDEVAKVILKTHSCSVDLDEEEQNGGGYTYKIAKQDLKDCTEINHRIKEEMYNAVVSVLLSGGTIGYDGEDKETSSGKRWSEWNAGRSIPVSELEKLFHPTLLNSFSGGLKHMLSFRKSHFNVTEDGIVSLRDYRDPEQLHSRKVHKVNHRGAAKVFSCWFHRCHPQGCVLPTEECQGSHGEDDLLQY